MTQNGNSLHPEELWDEFKDSLSEDFSRNNDVIVSHQMAYAHINSLLINEGKSLADFPTMDQSVEIDIILPEENDRVQMREIGEQQYEQLNNQQKEIVDYVLQIGKSAILAPRNIDVDEINKKVTNLLDSNTERRYTGIESTENCNNGDDMDEVLTPEYLNTLNPPSLPPYELCLRKNCISMLIRNISINEGLCNGDRTNNIVFLNRITLYCQNEFPFSFKRRQFPVKLAFAMTINKSQGQTFDKIGIDLRRNVFNHGQLYVAMSSSILRIPS
ncbi:ATP-dependent DNA helicase PIF1-like [Nasonia vitripennis]|uniref:DNA helicase Pif1-like 2B domain-containing protein n=1 Tax=Nasonia vitripennis TaxID=7425 RepID=A0A7M7QNK2_NASVI|nr:ATP-dependent DNA helicase PIF1-like [Nasonia vitripennis]